MIIENKSYDDPFKEIKVSLTLNHYNQLHELKRNESIKICDTLSLAYQDFISSVKNDSGKTTLRYIKRKLRNRLENLQNGTERKEIKVKIPQQYYKKLKTIKTFTGIDLKYLTETALDMYFKEVANF